MDEGTPTRARLLVVDDDAGNRVPLVRLLANAGVDARGATSGPEALAVLDGFRPHLVLLDVMMPDMDGFEVLRLMRADRRHDGIAVLMYTALGQDETRWRALVLGAQGYVLKGTAFADVLAEVRRHVAAA